MKKMIGWVLLSREAVARAEEALTSGEKGVRDEVGFLALHQGFADRFFPGTSVLHTRLRYALFVPWLMQNVAANSSVDLAQKLSAAETILAGQLRSGADADGIIGGRVWPRPTAQPPSMSYWNALGTWGILRPRPDGSMPSRTETMRRLAQERRRYRTKMTDDDGGTVDDDPASPFVLLPQKPDALGVRGEPLDFKLSSAEQAFLRKHLLSARRPGTTTPCLLSRLTESGIGSEAEDLWVAEISDVADKEDRAALAVARQAAALAGIGRAVYAALTENAHANDGFTNSRIHQNHLNKMVELYGRDARTIDLNTLSALLPNLSNDLHRILSETQHWLAKGAPDPTALHDAYAKAERGRKGLRARLPNTVAGRQRRAEWHPEDHPLAEPLHYRWGNVRRLLADLNAA